MNILQSGIKSASEESDVEFIPKKSIYVYITDYNKIFLLKEFKFSPGNHKWVWVSLNKIEPWDLSDKNNIYEHFEDAINRKVNDFYTTVYQFENFENFIKNYNKIKYIDSIKIKFKSKEKEN